MAHKVHRKSAQKTSLLVKETFGLAMQHCVKFADTAIILAGEFEVIHPAYFLVLTSSAFRLLNIGIELHNSDKHFFSFR